MDFADKAREHCIAAKRESRRLMEDDPRASVEIFAKRVFEIMKEACGSEQGGASWYQAMDRAVAYSEEMLAPHRKASGVECGPGCPYCCHIRVEAYPPEIIRIHSYLGKCLGEESRMLIRERLERIVSSGQATTLDYWPDNDRSCPFLIDDSCSIYEVRPWLCRGPNSLSKKACAENYMNYSCDTVPHWRPNKLFVAAMSGVLCLLLQKAGVDYHAVELSTGIALLDQSPGLADQWGRGGSVFQAARTADNNSDEIAQRIFNIVSG